MTNPENLEQKYVSGNMKDDAARLGRGGWLVGVFFTGDEAEAARASGHLEVKYWSYARGGGQTHSPKVSETVEWTLILSGKVRSVIGDDYVTLGAGDYALIHPGTPNNLVDTVLEDTIGITIKSPSDPSAKKVIKPVDPSPSGEC